MYQGLIVILIVNVVNAMNIIVLGVIPVEEYIREIMPITFPAGLILSILFSLIIRDFQLGLLRDEGAIREYAAIIHRSGEELLMIISDILDLSKVEAGRLDIINEELNVSEIPELLAMQFAVTAKQKGLEFNISMDENVPLMIHSDPH